MISVGLSMPPRRWRAPWSGMPHSTTASYWASRATRVVGVSRFSVRARNRARNSPPLARLVWVGGCEEDVQQALRGRLLQARRHGDVVAPAVHPRTALRGGRREDQAPD